MGAVKIDTSDLSSLIGKISKLSEDFKEEVDAELEEGAREFVKLAKQEAPADMGGAGLRGAIDYDRIKFMEYEIFAGKHYAPYMEFGTKKRFRPIPGIDSSKFRGKGTGDYFDFLNAILDWTKRKGIIARISPTTGRRLKESKSDLERRLDVAQAIANSIIRHGVRPQPFFYKQYDVVVPKMIQRINNILNDIF